MSRGRPEVRILDTTVTDETIDLGVGELTDFIHGSTLERCTLLIHASGFRALTIAQSVLRECTIVAKRPHGAPWTDVVFDRCVLRGTFSGAEFGYRPRQLNTFRGDVIACDFSAARLHSSRFNSVSLDGLGLQGWPQLIVDPHSLGPHLEVPDNEPWLAGWKSAMALAPPETVAEAFWVPYLLKKTSLDEAAFRLLVAAAQERAALE
jgi:hypothetical protein